MKGVFSFQMREIDERSEREFGITSLALMENAGKAVAGEALKMLKAMPEAKQPKVVICCGRGNNGGDGIACGRVLKKQEIEVSIFSIPPGEKSLREELQHQLNQAKTEGLEIKTIDDPSLIDALAQANLVIDALLGTGSKGKPMGPAQKAIQKIMKAGKPILALDIPSGIDSDTGYHTGVFIQAAKTATLGLPKVGLLKPHAQRNVGELIIVDIGHPKQLLEPYLK